MKRKFLVQHAYFSVVEAVDEKQAKQIVIDNPPTHEWKHTTGEIIGGAFIREDGDKGIPLFFSRDMEDSE